MLVVSISLLIIQAANFVGANGIDPDDFSPILPLPTYQSNGSDTLLVTSALRFTLCGKSSNRSAVLKGAIVRYHSLIFGWGAGSNASTFDRLEEVRVAVSDGRDDTSSLRLGVDESYTLNVSSPIAEIKAATVWGALRGLETMSQLIEFRGELGEYNIRFAPWSVKDAPAFAHRGLMIDTARHFLPVPTILRQIDAASYCKLNTLHIHFVDSDAFPVESTAFPELSKLGALGSGPPAPRPAYSSAPAVYSVEDQMTIVEYGRHRGVRIVPEFDLPGHAQIWSLALPELFTTCDAGTSSDGEWKLRQQLDMAADGVADFLASFIGEMAARFPGGVIHLGGDEVDVPCINSSTAAQAWLQDHNATSRMLYADFERRAHDIAARDGVSLTTWNDVFLVANDTGIWPRQDAIVHSWTIEPTPVIKRGYRVVTSKYIDAGFSNGGTPKTWEELYNDNLMPANLNESEQSLYLGAEAVMWGEATDQFNIDSKVWFRTSAFAERLWSTNASISDRVLPFPASWTSPDINARLIKHRCRLLQRGIAAQAYTSILLPSRGRWTQCELFLPTEAVARRQWMPYEPWSP